ncbi:MAG: Gfo/Idh/MocA family protein [Armatimonadota bacterium]
MTYSAALIGLGEIGSLYAGEAWRGSPSTHTEAFEAVDATELAAACDISQQRREAFSQARPDVPVFATAEEMMAEASPDIVAIATPHATHPQLVETCVEGGARGLIIEKPLATDLAGADRIINACTEHDVTASVSYLRRWDANFQELKRIVETGEMGDLVYMRGHMSRFKPYGWQADARMSGGFLAYDPTHLIDLYLWLGGPAEWVQANVERRDETLDVEDCVLANIGFENGVRAHLEADAYRDYFEFSIDVQMSAGRFEYHRDATGSAFRIYEPVVVDEKWSFMQQGQWELRESQPLQVQQIAELVSCIESGEQPTVTLGQARDVVELTMAIYESGLRTEPVTVPLSRADNPLLQMLGL